MLIYIIRHGETLSNRSRAMQGWTDGQLSDNGRFLAKETGLGMKGIKFDDCFSSPLVRALETARIVLNESGNRTRISTDSRLKEMYFGKQEGMILTDEEWKRFFSDPFTYGRFPEGECIQDVCRRTQAFLQELIERNDAKTYLISTHGVALRAMINHLYEDPNDFWQGRVPYNCAVNIIEAENGKACLIERDKIYYDQKYGVDWFKLQRR